MEKADVLFFLLDGKVGVTNDDRAIASYSISFAFFSSPDGSERSRNHSIPGSSLWSTRYLFSTLPRSDGRHFLAHGRQWELPALGRAQIRSVPAGSGRACGRFRRARRRAAGSVRSAAAVRRSNQSEQRERYAKILEAKEAKASRSRQGYCVRTNVDVVESSGATDEKNTRDLDDEILQLTILGIPNSGKSTLLNTLLKTDRFITGSIPGLTRDTVSTEIEFHNRRIRVVDTPGIPKADGVLPPSLNSLSVFHAHKQLEYSHVVALILDGSRLLTKHDLALAKEVLDKGRGLFVILNKSDVMQSPAAAKKQLVQYMDRFVPQVGSKVALEVGWARSLDRRFGTLWKGN